jgi:hypothetical protein
MKHTHALVALSAIVLPTVAAVHAAEVTALITADNHYAVYNITANTIAHVGGNELGAGGAPGAYNWSEPELWKFQTDDVLYIAAWSDDSVAQGLLAQLDMNGMALNSGNARWDVFATDQNRGDGDPHPDASEIAGFVAIADTGNLWEKPYIGEANGASPWAMVPGITTDALWMWKSVDGDSDPLRGGSGESEMLIFRVSVPAPGSAAIACAGGALLTRRRRQG